MKLYILENNVKIEIYAHSSPLGAPGGEGAVYKIDTTKYSEYCVKIYHDRSKWDVSRIEYMINHPPKSLESLNFRYKICWPQFLVYDGLANYPVGYLMSLAFPKSRTLKILDSTHTHKTMKEEFPNDKEWWKYERSEKQGIINRIKILNNISIAVNSIHEVGSYVIGDIKPENILSTHDGMISIIDTDSFQISDGTNVLYTGSAITNEYLAPESYLRISNKLPLNIANDLFAVAIFFYKVLIGCHPYTGRKKSSPYNQGNSLEYNIQNGLFTFGDKQTYLSIPKGGDPHEYFHTLPNKIQELFQKAFSLSNPYHRPNTFVWIEALSQCIDTSGQIKGKKNIKSKAIGNSFSDKMKIFWAEHQKQFIWAIIICFICSLCFFLISTNTKGNYKEYNVMHLISQKEVEIAGVYKLKQKLNGSESSLMHAEVAKIDDYKFKINIFEETGFFQSKDHGAYTFDISENGDLYSNYFGNGEISYNEKYDEISLNFTDNNNVIWIFTRP